MYPSTNSNPKKKEKKIICFFSSFCWYQKKTGQPLTTTAGAVGQVANGQ